MEKVRIIASRNYLTRFANHDIDTRAIAGHISTISWSIQSFTVSYILPLDGVAAHLSHWQGGRIDCYGTSTCSERIC